MANEDDLHVAIAALDEEIEEHEETFGEVLNLLGHGTRHVHQAEHDGLSYRPRHGFKAVEAHIDGIEKGDLFLPPAKLVEFRAQLFQFRILWLLRLEQLNTFLQRPHLLGARSVQGDAPRQAVTHGAQQVDVRWRAAGGVSRSLEAHLLGAGYALLHQIGKFEILEENVEELFS